MELVIKPDMRALRKTLNTIQKKQLPFAMSLALTRTAGRVRIAWQDILKIDLDRPTPFTVNAVAEAPARKTHLVATVYVRPVAAQYLKPFLDGGPHFLGKKKGLLTPKKALPTNAYGNLPKGKLAALKARSNVYVGPLKLRSGQTVSGVWQRGKAGKARGKRGAGLKSPAGLKLLIRFSDPLPVKQRLPFNARAVAEVRRYFQADFAVALNQAVATAR